MKTLSLTYVYFSANTLNNLSTSGYNSAGSPDERFLDKWVFSLANRWCELFRVRNRPKLAGGNESFLHLRCSSFLRLSFTFAQPRVANPIEPDRSAFCIYPKKRSRSLPNLVLISSSINDGETNLAMRTKVQGAHYQPAKSENKFKTRMYSEKNVLPNFTSTVIKMFTKHWKTRKQWKIEYQLYYLQWII